MRSIPMDLMGIPAQTGFAGISQPGCPCIAVASQGLFVRLDIFEFTGPAATPVVQPLWLMLPGLPRRESSFRWL